MENAKEVPAAGRRVQAGEVLIKKLRDPSSTFTLSTGVLGFSIVGSVEKKLVLIKSAHDPQDRRSGNQQEDRATSAAPAREQGCEVAHPAQRARPQTGRADAPGTALESKGSMRFSHVTPALFGLRAEPPANASAQDRTGGAPLKDQRMEKLAWSGALSSCSNSWRHVRET